MTTLTIVIPDREAQEVSAYIKQKGGKVVTTVTTAALKRSQQSSLILGLTEAMLIKKGDIESTPLSELWDE